MDKRVNHTQNQTTYYDSIYLQRRIFPFCLCATDPDPGSGGGSGGGGGNPSEVIHEVLDWLGFVWDGADLINAGLYLLEGDHTMAALSAVAFIPMVGSVLAKGSKVAVKAARATAKLSSQYVQSAVKALSYTATIGKKADAISDVGRGLKKGLKSSVDDVVQKAATKTTKAAKTASKAADGAVASGQSFRKMDLQFFAQKSNKTSKFYQDVNAKWHRSNGQFASNAEVGINSPAKVSTGSHGNSLSDPRTNYGYAQRY